ncbi:MAG: DUF4296 domain-containing protein [Muricauda sp.]|nr:DUF4296 domain-containing protein [Allomuricauda sp.]
MKKVVLYFLGFFMLVSCAEKVVEEPDNLIPKDKMTSILLDLAILNASKSAAKNKFEDTGINIMDFLYRKYAIDSTQFAQSDLYYASNPLEYQSIYETVDAKLKVAKKDLEERSKRRSDSIRKANLAKSDSIKGILSDEEPKPIEP